MRYLTPQERQRIENKCDMLKGNINRMCVTDDIKELYEQTDFAVRRIFKIKNIAVSRFADQVKEGRKVKESEKKILHDLGLLCRDYRIANGQTIKDVSIQTGYSLSTVGYFERGRNDSAKIVLWYVGHYKIPMEKIMRIYDLYTLRRCEDE